MDENLLSDFDSFSQPTQAQPIESTEDATQNSNIDINEFDNFTQPQAHIDEVEQHRPENIDDESWIDIKKRVSKFISDYTPVGATFNMVGKFAGEAMQKEGSQVSEAMSIKSRVDNIESTYQDLADMVKSATGDKESAQRLKEKQDKMNNEVVDILEDRGIEAYYDKGKLLVVTKDKDGNDVLNDLDDEVLDSVLGGFKASAGEIGGALMGAAGGATASQRMLPLTAPIQARATAGAIGALGGGYLGATAGRATDLIRNAISLNKEINTKEVLEKSLTAGTADIAGTAVVGGLARVASKAVEPVVKIGEKLNTLMKQGNLSGAKELVKKQYNLTDENIDSMFKEYSKDVKGYEDLSGDDLLKAKLTVAVQQQPQGAADIIQAIKSSKTAAIETSKEIDARAKEVMNSAHKFSKKPSAIKRSIQSYEKAVGRNYGEVRKLIGEALPSYKADLNLMEFADTLKDLNTRVIDPQVKDKLSNLVSSLSSQKTETINDLIDTRQLFNKFYGKNSSHFESKPDKEALLSIQQSIDSKIDEALNTLPKNVSFPIKKAFDDAKKMYSNMFKTQDTATYNAIFKKGASEADIGQALIKYSKATDGDLESVLSKLSPVQRTKSEFSILTQMVKNATFKADAKAINFEKLLDDIGSSKAIFKTPEAKQFLKNIETYDTKFGKDSDFQRVSLGIADKETKNIATTLEGKAKMAVANKYFAALQRMLPTDTAKGLSLQKAIESTLEKSRSPKEFLFKATKIKGMPNKDRQNLKQAIKEIVDKEKILESIRIKQDKRKETKKVVEKYRKKQVSKKVEAEAKARWEKAVQEKKELMEKKQDTKKINRRAEEIKDLAEPKIGGSEDEAKQSVKNALSKNTSDEAKYKNMSKDDIAELERQNNEEFLDAKVFNDDLEKNDKNLYNVGNRDLIIEYLVKKNKGYLTHTIELGEPLGKIGKRLGIDLDKFKNVKYKKIDNGYIAKVQSDEDLANEANQLFTKGGDNLAAGTIAGIEEDENGNITFDAEKFVLGLGGYTAVKALAKNKTLQKEFKGYIGRALDDLESNPKFNYLVGKQNIVPIEKMKTFMKDFNNADDFSKEVDSLGYGNYSISDIVQHIDKNSKGRLDFDEIRNSLKDGGYSYFKTKVKLKDLKVDDANRVAKENIERSGDINTRIVVGKDGDVIDGRHRVLQAIENGETDIDAYIPSKDYFNQLNNTKPKVFLEKAIDNVTRDANFKKWFDGSSQFMKNEDGSPRVFYHQTSKENAKNIYDSKFDVTKVGARKSDNVVPDGFFFKTNDKDIGVGDVNKNNIEQMPVFLNIKNPYMATDRNSLKWAMSAESPKYKKLLDEASNIDKKYTKKLNIVENKHDEFAKKSYDYEKMEYKKEAKKELDSLGLEMDNILKEWEEEILQNATKSREEITRTLKSMGYDGINLRNDNGSFNRNVNTWIAFKPNQIKSVNNKGTFSKDGNILKGALTVPAIGLGVSSQQENN